MSMEDIDMSEFSYMDSDMPRNSVLSTDSGIERDMAQGLDSEMRGTWHLLRRGGMRVKPSVTDSMAFLQDALVSGSALLKQQQRQRHMAANIVVMGDDRVLGRLARAYYTLRYTVHTTPVHYVVSDSLRGANPTQRVTSLCVLYSPHKEGVCPGLKKAEREADPLF